ncbi:MAG: Zn-ribbon domain-containing OB-fold protein [Syntrophaceae bacterium]|nr:Zn-ribbon domain-containing OB-fold protein [Syntrophaceae bacterium]
MEFKDFSLAFSQTKVGRFAKDLAEGRIMMTVCRGCGKKYYPPRADCSHCMGSEMEWKPIKGEGSLVTFTKIYVPPEHFALRQPLMPFSTVQFEPCPIGILEVEEGLRIMGWMPKMEIQKIRVGMKLKASPQILPDGKVTIVLEAM